MQTPTWPSFNATLSNPGAIGQERQTIMERVLATTLLPEIRTCERLVNETGEGSPLRGMVARLLALKPDKIYAYHTSQALTELGFDRDLGRQIYWYHGPPILRARASFFKPLPRVCIRSGKPTAALDPKTRQAINKHLYEPNAARMLTDADHASQAINKHLCEPNAARMLTDAGRSSQQARNVDGQKPWLLYKTFEDKCRKTQLAEEFGPVESTSIAKVSNTPKAPCADRRYPQKEGPGILTGP
ncbi:MAG: hypothetical protein Q9199_003801 [Rusavskia elegans]